MDPKRAARVSMDLRGEAAHLRELAKHSSTETARTYFENRAIQIEGMATKLENEAGSMTTTHQERAG